MKSLLTHAQTFGVMMPVEQVIINTVNGKTGSNPSLSVPVHPKGWGRELPVGFDNTGTDFSFEVQYRFNRVASLKSSERQTGEGVAAERTTHQPQLSCAIDAQGTPCRPREQSSVRIGNLQHEARHSDTTGGSKRVRSWEVSLLTGRGTSLLT